MSLISIIGGIVSVVTRVATIGYGLVRTVVPILEGLRPAVEEVDSAFDFIEDKIAKGGVGADDFLDRNLAVIESIENISGKGVAAFQQMNTVAMKLRVFSQEQTPDTITPAEAEEIAAELLMFKELFKSWGTEIDNSLPAMKALMIEEG